MARSLIEKYMKEVAKIKDEKGTFIIIYSPKGRYMPKEYYYKIKELSKKFRIYKPDKGTFIICYSLRVAHLLLKLTKHYCPDVRLFRAEDITP